MNTLLVSFLNIVPGTGAFDSYYKRVEIKVNLLTQLKANILKVI